MGYLISHQSDILIACGLASIFLGFFVMVMKFKSIRKKQSLIMVEMCVGLLMLADEAALVFNGNASTVGYWGVRISNFLVFFFTIVNVIFLCGYVTNVFMETGEFEKPPKRLKLGFMLSTIGAVLVVISVFTGMYYTFDANNVYQRGPLFIVSCLLAFSILLIIFSFVIQYRKLVRRGIFLAICSFTLLPVLAGVVQMFWNDLYLIDYASWFAAVAIFWFALLDQNDELTKAAFTEVGTGLPNADGYQYEVNYIIEYGDITQYTAFYFDIIRMSHVNNKYGKRIGDLVIKLYAENVKKFLDEDEILGRLGGNYFVSLIKNEHVDAFLQLISDVPVAIEFEGAKETLHVAAVAGAYRIHTKNLVAAQILSNTSMAVAYAKNTAHKQVVFIDEALEEELSKIRETEVNTRRGLRNEEFEAFYQPKVDTSTMTLCGAEALVRWRKNGNLVSPAQFIPIMERNDSICNLDFYVLEHVCKDIKGWIEQGMEPVPVSVNFSRRNLGNPILSEAISKVVERYEIPKRLIQIEVTETLDEYPMSYLVGVVEAAQRYGMTVAIDDFGMGSSSINLLKMVKFDILKIDKSFVDYKNEQEKQLLRDMLQMISHIGIDVIAEGVESRELAEELREMGCAKIQGYAFDKPLEKIEFEKRLQAKKYT